jgi:hypothetical protein
MTEMTYNEEKLRAIYEKVIETPNKNSPKKGFIICPECGEEILMIPTLKVMSEAIENHVQKHKSQLRGNPIKGHQVAIFVRLSLMTQVLQQSCKTNILN